MNTSGLLIINCIQTILYVLPTCQKALVIFVLPQLLYGSGILPGKVQLVFFIVGWELAGSYQGFYIILAPPPHEIQSLSMCYTAFPHVHRSQQETKYTC